MRSYALSAGKDGYRLLLLDVGWWAPGLEWTVTKVCDLSRQHFCHLLCDKAFRLTDRHEKVVGTVELPADKVKELDRDFWSIFEEE